MAERKPLHDEIIEHDLVLLGPEQIAKLTIIELRGLRDDLAALPSLIAEAVNGRADRATSDARE